MSVERLTGDSPSRTQGVALFSRLIRLLSEVEELSRQLERIETETRETLGSTAADEGRA